MTLIITDDVISGDHTGHTARRVTGRQPGWEVSWLPGRRLSRNTAITAMTLADIAGTAPLQPRDRIWPHIQGWAAEIGLTAPDALTLISQTPGGKTAGKDDAGHSDPEAAG
jgi:hypothetical protein